MSEHSFELVAAQLGWDIPTQLQILQAILEDCSQLDMSTVMSEIAVVSPQDQVRTLICLVDDQVPPVRYEQFMSFLLAEMRPASPAEATPVPPSAQPDIGEIVEYVDLSMSRAMSLSPCVRDVTFTFDDLGAIMQVPEAEFATMQVLLETQVSAEHAFDADYLIQGWRGQLGSRLVVVLVCDSPSGPWVDCYTLPVDTQTEQRVVSCKPRRTLYEPFDVGHQQFVIRGQ